MTRSNPGVPNPPPISRRFGEAMEFARSKHNGQTRKGTDIPYLGHLLAVAALAIEDAASDSALFERTEEVAIAAVLHDIVEDTFDRGEERVTVEELRGRFGWLVACWVLLLVGFVSLYGYGFVELFRDPGVPIPSGRCGRAHQLRGLRRPAPRERCGRRGRRVDDPGSWPRGRGGPGEGRRGRKRPGAP